MQASWPNLEAIVERLERLVSTKTVVGDPIQVGDVTLVPILDVSFGFGGGGGESPEKHSGSGGGAGAGARIAPKAILVIRGSDVTLLPVHKGGTLEKLAETLPDVINRLRRRSEEREQEVES